MLLVDVTGGHGSISLDGLRLVNKSCNLGLKMGHISHKTHKFTRDNDDYPMDFRAKKFARSAVFWISMLRMDIGQMIPTYLGGDRMKPPCEATM